MIARFEQMEVWQLSHQLVLAVYRTTQAFPPDERFGLTSQIRRSALAVPANLAEGGARGHRKEYLQFCYVARGSAAELRYLLRVSADLGYLTIPIFEQVTTQLIRVEQMLNGLIRSLKKPPHQHGARGPEPEAR